MNTHEQTRYAHELLNDISSGHQPSEDELNHLRSFLPPLPKQKTLEEIIDHIYDAWMDTSGNEWGANGCDLAISVEDWLEELHRQLKGLKDALVSSPSLPAGMRIAEHMNFGRVVVSPGVGIDRCHEIFYLEPGTSSGSGLSEVEPDSLTFIDAEPTHPEFLETEADYENAPKGTIVAWDDSLPWYKFNPVWVTIPSVGREDAKGMSCVCRRVLRWGSANEQL